MDIYFRNVGLALAIPLLMLLAACGGGGSEPTGPTFSGMRIVAGRSVSDTVLAKPVQALIVEVLDNGRPRTGVVVRFEGIPVDGADSSASNPFPAGRVAGVASNDFARFVTVTTDQNGRASALVQLGTRAGQLNVQVTCPGLSEIARYTVLPGNAAQVIAAVRDTLIRVGGSFVVSARSADRFGNARSQDKVTYAVMDTLGTVDATGTVRATQTVGRSTVVSRVNAFTDTTRFTVVPNVSLTAVFEGPVGIRNIVTLHMDGSSFKVIGPVAQGAFPAHARTGDLIAYTQQMTGGVGIKLMDGSGSTRVLVGPSETWWGASYPVFSRDGVSVYFGGYKYNAAGIWRMGLDGSGTTLLTVTDSHWMPAAVSPDESRIAFPRSSGMFVQSLATGDTVRIGGKGWFPSFSPDGQRVAYYEEGAGFKVVNVDGSASSYIWAVGGVSPASWLPDGRWILTVAGGAPALVNASSSEVIPLSHLSQYREVNLNP